MILVDGVPVASCLLPVEDLEGCDVHTVEGIGARRLHPIQFGFMAYDGLQCGFCTPGFIVESVAFFDAWRSVNGKATPSRGDVARGLAGHLCRCAAYEGIYAAVQAACAGDFDDVTDVDTPRPDARVKVTGAARYTADIKVDGMQHGRVIRSTIANGFVTAVDPRPALQMDGVTGFVDLLDRTRRIRHLGQAIGALAAYDEQTSRSAAAAVVVTYDQRPAVFDIASALASDAPNVHGRGWSPPNNNEGRNLPNIRSGNRRGPNVLTSRRPLKAVRTIARTIKQDPTRVVSGTWTTQIQIHTALEPHVTIAAWPTPSTLDVHTSTQGVTVVQKQLAKLYGLKTTDVAIHAEYVGGAFGAKQLIDTDVVAAVELARVVAAPVRVAYDRMEELSYAGYRPGAEMELSVAASEQGSLTAMRMKSWAHGGAAGGQLIAAFLRFNYQSTPHYLADYDVLTNLPMGKAFRAPGAPLTLWAAEQAIDELAGNMGIDPIELRERSNPKPLRRLVYDAARSHPLWGRRGSSSTDRYRRGVGVAFASWLYILDPDVEVTVETRDNGLCVVASAQDMGNGTRGVLADAVAGVFGVPSGTVDVQIGGTGAGHGPLSSGSRTTASIWPAANAAAAELRDLIAKNAIAELGMTGAVVVPGGLEHEGELIGWDDIIAQVGPHSVRARRAADTHVPLLKRGINWALLRTNVTHGEPGKGFTEGGTIVEVEVDTLLGRVRPIRAHGIVAAGTIHSPALAVSQVNRGIIQGFGFALYEERRLHPANGLNLTSNLEDYHIPGIGDTPEITVEFIEGGFDDVPGGGVGISELSTVAVAAATGNAVADAIGVRIRDLPIRPDRIIGGSQ